MSKAICHKNMCGKTVPIILVFIFSLFTVNIFGQKNRVGGIQKRANPCVQTGNGAGISGPDFGAAFSPASVDKPVKNYPLVAKPLKIISKPRAFYTDEARRNCVEGVVKIRITFFANGKPGNFKVVNGLSNGLTEQSIEAAKKIKFEPAAKRGKPITVTKTVSYNFTIY